MKTTEVFDTCILIDYLNGIDGAAGEIDRAAAPAISHVTWMEVMAGATPEDAEATRRFLKRFAVLKIDDPIGERAVAIRQGREPGLARKPKLPDAIVYATALTAAGVLVTRNGKDFPAGTKSVRLPGYSVSH